MANKKAKLSKAQQDENEKTLIIVSGLLHNAPLWLIIGKIGETVPGLENIVVLPLLVGAAISVKCIFSQNSKIRTFAGITFALDALFILVIIGLMKSSF